MQELSFDAWGNRRNPATWRAFTGIPPTSLFDHGFTGHEHLYAFGLVNMNGRMYDPVVSRMLSPDPYVQSPHYSQSYNRYSYVSNNPLKFYDPSGYAQKKHFNDNENEIVPPLIFGGRIGPGSGNHWSDSYRGEYGNFMLGNESSYNSIYGPGAWNLAYSVFSKPGARADWQSGLESLSKGMWITVPTGQLVGRNAFSRTYRYGTLTGPEMTTMFVKFDIAEGGGGESWLSRAWNSDIDRFYIPDVIYANGSGVLTFLGGGGADIGLALPLRGKSAGTVYLYSTLKGKAGLPGGVSVNIGRSNYLGPVSLFDFDATFGGKSSVLEGEYFIGASISASEYDRHGNSLLSIDLGVGPGIGGIVISEVKTEGNP